MQKANPPHTTPGFGPSGVVSSDRGDELEVGERFQLPRSIGPFELIEQLGEGGMGTVYRARQRSPVERDVALKLIHEARFASADSRARFEAERQVLARLQHPNVAQMFEAGTTRDGQPYFAMELVSGELITEHADRRRLSIPARLALFAAVCRGVQHAHQRGIVHRDLKPSNILVAEVDGQAIPKVIDFGVAKALDEGTSGAGLTGLHAIGTPEYMSPEALEVAAGGVDVDTRSDVYALGLVLDELLTGTHPWSAEDGRVSRIFTRILTGELPSLGAQIDALDEPARAAAAANRGLSPAEHKSAVGGDLDAIVAKAAARDREARYASASELGADVDRFLAHEPLVARAGGARYRLRKFARRHRLAVAATLGVGVALLVGALGTSIGFVRARRAEGAALAEAERARLAASSAERVTAFLVELFSLSDPEVAQGSVVSARELLDRAARRLPHELESEPLVRATMLETIGVIYRRLGLLDPAETLLEQALAVRRTTTVEPSPAIARTLTELGSLAAERGEYAVADELLGSALALAERTAGPESLVAASTLFELSTLRSRQGRRPEAAAFTERALAIRERELGPEHAETATALNQLANVYRRLGQYERAEATYRRALEIRQRVLGERHPDLANTLLNFGILLRARGRPAESEPYYHRALEIFERAYGPRHATVAAVHNNLGNLYEDLGRGELAAEHLRAALALRRELLPDGHVDIAITVHNLGLIEKTLGHRAEARQLLVSARADLERAVGAEHPYSATATRSLGELELDERRFEAAERLLRQAWDLQRRTIGEDHPDTLTTQETLVRALAALGRSEESATLAADLARRRAGANPAAAGAAAPPPATP